MLRATVGGGERAMAEHRHERHDPRTARDEEDRPVLVRRPYEVAADRPAHLESVAGMQHVAQVRRDFAVVEPFDGELDMRVFRRRRDRVRALRLIAVVGDEPHVHVLAGAMPAPSGHVEHERVRARRLAANLDDAGDLPRQSRRGDRSARLAHVRDRPGTAAPSTDRRGRGSRAAPRTPARRGR